MFYLRFENNFGEEKIKQLLFSILLNPEEGSLWLAKAKSVADGSKCTNEISIPAWQQIVSA